MRYNSWIIVLNNKTSSVSLCAWNKLLILEANTSGEPIKIVHKHMTIGGPDPNVIFALTLNEIKFEFSSSICFANALNQRVDSFSVIKSPHDLKKN